MTRPPVCPTCLLPHVAGLRCAETRRGAVLRDLQFAHAVSLGLTEFYRRKKLGEFRRFELDPQLADSNTRYSGTLVQDWLDGIPVPERAVVSVRVVQPVLGRRPGRPRAHGVQHTHTPQLLSSPFSGGSRR